MRSDVEFAETEESLLVEETQRTGDGDGSRMAGVGVGRKRTLLVGMALLMVGCVALFGGWTGTVDRRVDLVGVQAKYTGSSYCYEESNFGDCWKQKPPEDTPACTVDSEEELCKCPGTTECDVNLLHEQKPVYGLCQSHQLYIHHGKQHKNETTGNIDITSSNDDEVDGKVEAYCTTMKKLDQWHDKHLVKRETDGANVTDKGKWSCRGKYTWEEGKCQLKQRFLGDTCWNGWLANPGGDCATSEEEYGVACYEGRCRPKFLEMERKRCECSWLGWHFLVACSSDTCDGHACVLTTMDMNKYCDYSSDQNW